jgi:hypothetical protein
MPVFVGTRRAILNVAGVAAAPAGTYSDFGFRDSDSSVATNPYSKVMDIGAANANRYVIVAIANTNGFNPNISGGVTVGGESCSQVVNGGDSVQTVNIYITDAPFTTGTTATVVVDYFFSTPDDVRVCVWSVVMSSPTAHNTATGTDSDTSRALAGLVIPAGGFAVYVLSGDANVDAGTIDQSFQERVDSELSSHYCYAAVVESAEGSTATITVTTTGAGDSAFCAASWKGDGT